jgi:hypothetical protein
MSTKERPTPESDTVMVTGHDIALRGLSRLYVPYDHARSLEKQRDELRAVLDEIEQVWASGDGPEWVELCMNAATVGFRQSYLTRNNDKKEGK